MQVFPRPIVTGPLSHQKQTFPGPFTAAPLNTKPFISGPFLTIGYQRHYSFKHAFPTSFDTVGSIPNKYSVCLDSTRLPVQYARHNLLIHYKKAIEKTFKNKEHLQIIAPVTRPTEWVSSITYPTKPDGSLRI